METRKKIAEPDHFVAAQAPGRKMLRLWLWVCFFYTVIGDHFKN
jgi:hypothetical protein